MGTDMKHEHLPHREELIGAGMVDPHLSAPTLIAQIGHFLRHFLEMCVSMCVGGNILNLLVFRGAEFIGYPDLRQQSPELSLVLIAINLTLPMTAWMYFRGMGWRPNLEMSSVAIALALLMIGLVWLGIVANSALQIGVGPFCGIVCAGMVVVMLFRLDLYAGRKGHHAHAA
jgi:Ca2+/Na+ antiporter